MNYEELVKALRQCVTKGDLITICDGCPYKAEIGVDCENNLHKDAAAAIEALQAQLPKRGEWIWIQKANGGQYKGCSVCHAPIPTDSMLDYLDDEDCEFCYSCGAKMGGTDERRT